MEASVAAVNRFHEAAETFLHSRGETLSVLNKIDDDITSQYAGVVSTKGVATGLAAAAVPFMFVFPPVGIGLGIGAGVTGASAGLADHICDRAKTSELKAALEQDEQDKNAFMEALQGMVMALADLDLPNDDSMLKTVWAHVKKGGSVCWTSYSAFSSSMQIAQVAELITAVRAMGGVAEATVRMGTGAGGLLAKLGIVGTGMRSLTISMGGGTAAAEAGAVGVRVVASTSAIVLSGVCAGLSAVDLTMSILGDKPTRTSLRKVKVVLDKSIVELSCIVSTEREAVSDNVVKPGDHVYIKFVDTGLYLTDVPDYNGYAAAVGPLPQRFLFKVNQCSDSCIEKRAGERTRTYKRGDTFIQLVHEGTDDNRRHALDGWRYMYHATTSSTKYDTLRCHNGKQFFLINGQTTTCYYGQVFTLHDVVYNGVTCYRLEDPVHDKCKPSSKGQYWASAKYPSILEKYANMYYSKLVFERAN